VGGEKTGASKYVEVVKPMTTPENSTFKSHIDGNFLILNNSDAKSENFYSVDGFRHSLRAKSS
jgi:hypothetical protein